MTPYLFLLAYFSGAAATMVRGPIYGVYLYAFAFYFTPYRTWWEDSVPDLRYLQLAAILTLASSIIHGTWTAAGKNRMTGGVWLLVFLLVWMVTTSLWEVTGSWHRLGLTLFAKHLLVTVLVVRIVQEREQVRLFLLVNVIGGAWLGWLAWGKTGSRLEGVAGALGDANTLGMYLSAILIIASLMFLGHRGRYRIVAFLCLPLILNTVVLSGSRGAFVALVAGGLVAGWYCPRKLKLGFGLAGTLGVVMFFMLASDGFLERIATLTAFGEGTEEVNETSGSRLEIARAGWEMFKDHPMGTGFKGTNVLSGRYMEDSLLTAGDVRSAHNSLMSVLVDFGLVGISIYLLLYLWMFRKLGAVKRWADTSGDKSTGAMVAGVAGALAVVFVAGQSSDYYYAELQYWLLGITAVFVNQLERLKGEAESINPAPRPSGVLSESRGAYLRHAASGVQVTANPRENMLR